MTGEHGPGSMVTEMQMLQCARWLLLESHCYLFKTQPSPGSTPCPCGQIVTFLLVAGDGPQVSVTGESQCVVIGPLVSQPVHSEATFIFSFRGQKFGWDCLHITYEQPVLFILKTKLSSSAPATL